MRGGIKMAASVTPDSPRTDVRTVFTDDNPAYEADNESDKVVGGPSEISRSEEEVPVAEDGNKTGFIKSMFNRSWRTVSYGCYYGTNGTIRGIWKGFLAGGFFSFGMWYRSQPEQVGFCTQGSSPVVYNCPSLTYSNNTVCPSYVEIKTEGLPAYSLKATEYLLRFAPAIIGAGVGGVIGGTLGAIKGIYTGFFGRDDTSKVTKEKNE